MDRCRRRRGFSSIQGRAARVEPLEVRCLLSVSTPTTAWTAAGLDAAPSMTARPLTGAFPAGHGAPVGFSPAQIKHAYGIDAIRFSGGIVGDGSGQTVAIINAYDNPKLVDSTSSSFVNSDLHKFDVQFGLPDPPSFLKVNQNGGTSYPGTDANWANEAALDVEWVHAIAPKANILLVEANSAQLTDLISSAVQYARTVPGVSVVTMSFAAGEAFGETFYDSSFTTPSGHAGVTFVAASGDAASPGGYPAFSPNVVSVGATVLTLSNGNYGSETGRSNSGGGISSIEPKPSYQSRVTQSKTMRTSPDVAMDGEPNTGVAVYDSYNGGANPWYEIGGTSLSCPVWGGIFAITNQGRARQGMSSMDGRTQTLPRLYQISSSDFHDIASGNNGFAATVGYDLVTGLGTPKSNLLVPDLGSLTTTTSAPGSISGNLYNDLNGDMKRESGEPNLNGRTFYLDLNKDGKLDNGEPNVKTDSNGNYKFSNLVGGKTYRVREVVPGGWRASMTTWYYDVSVGVGSNVTGKNFADTQRVYIGGAVFNDINSDGKQTSGEAGLSGWSIYLDLSVNGKWQSTSFSQVTSSSGGFDFGTLAAGTYRIRIAPKSGYKQTAPGGATYTVTLSSGQLALGKLFGEHKI
jgi:hypothetical protein